MERKLVIILRKTRLEELIQRYNTVAQAQFYIESLGEDFNDYLIEDQVYQNARKKLERTILSLDLRYQILERRFLSNYSFNPDDLVIALGQDGLVANTLKYLDRQELIGINPDSNRWEGRLLPFQVQDCEFIIKDCLKKRRSCLEVTMAKVQLNDQQSLLAVNDFYIGSKTHNSFRYLIDINGQEEEQSSSGIVVSAPIGGSAWLKSILTGAREIMGQFYRLPEKELNPFQSWNQEKLIYSVREPFTSLYSQARQCFGEINHQEKLIIKSATPENAVIFSDGIESDFLEFNSGSVATISIADKKGLLVQ